MPKRFKYTPTDTAFSPRLKAGDVIEARDAEHAAQLAASAVFTEVKSKPKSKAKSKPEPKSTPEAQGNSGDSRGGE